MNDRDTTPPPANDDHWEMFAAAMDLTIEGHRLIAQEIAYEMGLAWRSTMTALQGFVHTITRWRSSPSV